MQCFSMWMSNWMLDIKSYVKPSHFLCRVITILNEPLHMSETLLMLLLRNGAEAFEYKVARPLELRIEEVELIEFNIIYQN